jgi:hypothetical protein
MKWSIIKLEIQHPMTYLFWQCLAMILPHEVHGRVQPLLDMYEFYVSIFGEHYNARVSLLVRFFLYEFYVGSGMHTE